MKKIPAWAWFLGLVLLVVLWLVGSYNGLVSSQGNVDNKWADVEVQYQRRADLVPQLVETVQGVADFESSTLLEVTEARTNWLSAASNPDATLEEQITASSTFDSAFSRLLVSVESYPTLTATENFQTLQAQLEGTENRVAVARRDFNEAATEFNVKIRRIPTNIIANLFGFDAYPLFESSDGSEDAPSVEFNFES